MKTDLPKRFDLRHLSSEALFQGLDRLVANDCQRVAELVARDGEQCSFVDELGNRCQERGWLQKHHSTAVAKEGTAEGEGQIRILCRKHNLLEARRDFGDEFMRRKIEQARQGRQA